MTFVMRGDGCQEGIQAACVASIYDSQHVWYDLRRFVNVPSSMSCIEDEWWFKGLGQRRCQSLLIDFVRKRIRRIASVLRAKLSREAESSVADTLRVSATGGSGHVCPGKLNRRPLPSGDRRRLWSIWSRWIVYRIEFPSGCNEWEFSSGWNKRCHVSVGGLSA